MKKLFMATLVASAALLSACNGSSSSKKAEFKTNMDSVAYATGVAYGAQTIQNLENLKAGLIQSGSDSTAVEEFIRGLQDGFKSAEDKKQIAYYMGASMGVNLRTTMGKNLDFLYYGEKDSVNHVDPSNIIVGYVDFLKNKIALKDKDGKPMTTDAIMAYVQEASTKVYNDRMSKEYSKEIKAEKEFFAKLAKQEGIKPLKNGVYYKTVNGADGAQDLGTIFEKVTIGNNQLDVTGNTPDIPNVVIEVAAIQQLGFNNDVAAAYAEAQAHFQS